MSGGGRNRYIDCNISSSFSRAILLHYSSFDVKFDLVGVEEDGVMLENVHSFILIILFKAFLCCCFSLCS